MKRIGKITPTGLAPRGPDIPANDNRPGPATVPEPPPGRSWAAHFAELKMTWAMQVASDRRLSETALRVALVWPYWLNSKTLIAWPSQATVANEVSSSDRAVRHALKQLEECSHLYCLNQYRGGRISNRYRIVVNDVVLSVEGERADPAECGTADPVTPARPRPSERNARTDHHGAANPVSGGAAFRRTPEKTPDKTKEAIQTPANEPDAPKKPPVSKDRAEQIMREAFGARSVSETGYLRRE